jgi:hypothetical protein
MSGYNYESFGQSDVSVPDFRSAAGIVTKAPDFSLMALVPLSISCVLP